MTAWLLALYISLSPLSVHVNIVKGFEPLTLKVRIGLVPSSSHRSLCVGYENADSGAAIQSCRSLEGENEPASFWYEWKKLAAGRYVVYAVVEREALKSLEAIQRVEILSTQ